eukprot:43418-Eustigmatos_ZCMA.PRE.1
MTQRLLQPNSGKVLHAEEDFIRLGECDNDMRHRWLFDGDTGNVIEWQCMQQRRALSLEKGEGMLAPQRRAPQPREG